MAEEEVGHVRDQRGRGNDGRIRCRHELDGQQVAEVVETTGGGAIGVHMGYVVGVLGEVGAQVGSGNAIGAAAVLEEQRLAAAGGNEMQNQVGYPRVSDGHAHVEAGDDAVLRDVEEQVGGVFIEEGNAGVGIVERDIVHGQVHPQGVTQRQGEHARRVVEDAEVPHARRQRRRGNRRDAEVRISCGIQIVQVERAHAVRLRSGNARTGGAGEDVHAIAGGGPRHAGQAADDVHVQVRRVAGDVEEVHIGLARREVEGAEENVGIGAGLVGVRDDEEVRKGNRAGLERAVVVKLEDPQAHAILAEEVRHIAGTVGRVAEGVVDEAVGAQAAGRIGAAAGRVVVQGHDGAIVRERAYEIAEVLVHDGVGHRDALHDDVGGKNAVERDSTWGFRRAIRDVHGHGEQGNLEEAVGVGAKEGERGRGPEETVGAALLVLGLDADVEDFPDGGVGNVEQLVATAVGRAEGAGAAQDQWIQVGQPGSSRSRIRERAARDVKVNVRVAVAGAGEVGRQEGREGHVRSAVHHREADDVGHDVGHPGGDVGREVGDRGAGIIQVGVNVKRPLVGQAVGVRIGGAVEREQRRVGPDALVEIRNAVGDDVDGTVGEAVAIRGRREGDGEAGGGAGVRGEDQRIVLRNLVGVAGDGVDVDFPADDINAVSGRRRGVGERDEGVLHVVHRVALAQAANAGGLGDGAAGGDVVAFELRAVGNEVGDVEVEVVDELDGGDGIARRIGPGQRYLQVIRAAGDGRNGDIKGVILAGCHVVGDEGVLLHEHDGRGGRSSRRKQRHPSN